jgi:hypothetical protein
MSKKNKLMDYSRFLLIDLRFDAFKYFNNFRLEELKEDDVYYIKALMDYIERLESDLLELSKKNKQH